MPAFLALLVLVVGLYFINYINSHTKITVTLDQPASISFYSSTDPEEGLNYNPSKKTTDINSAGTFKIKKGNYVYVAKGQSNDYATQTKRIEVNNPTAIYVKLDFSQTKLINLKAHEEPAIKNLLAQTFPQQMKSYSISNSKLYKRGEWYSALLTPSDTSTQDVFQIVFNKSNGSWHLVTDPPEIIISRPAYPEIPSEIFENFSDILKSQI